jgi:hypothetical protein
MRAAKNVLKRNLAKKGHFLAVLVLKYGSAARAASRLHLPPQVARFSAIFGDLYRAWFWQYLMNQWLLTLACPRCAYMINMGISGQRGCV